MSAHAGVILKTKKTTIKQTTYSKINNECGHRDYGFKVSSSNLKKKQKIFKNCTNALDGT